MKTFQTVWSTSLVLHLNFGICSVFLKQSQVLWDSVRELSGLPGRTWSYGGTFKMLQYVTYKTSAKCKSVQMSYITLPDTPVDLTSTAKYFLMLPSPPGATQRAVRPRQSTPRCCSKHMELWRCIQYASIFDLWNSPTFDELGPLHRSVGDFESSWDLCAGLHEVWCHILTAVVHRVS